MMGTNYFSTVKCKKPSMKKEMCEIFYLNFALDLSIAI